MYNRFMITTKLKIRSFKTKHDWNAWLGKNHRDNDGVWIQFFKKDSGVRSVNYAEALDEALCFGWIDGQSKKHDEQSWIQKFTPRRKRSMWSKRNIENVERLIKEDRMKESGLKEFKNAKDDGRHAAAYDSPSTMQIPEDFLKAVSKNKIAKEFFASLNKVNKYAIAWRLQTAKKPETREKRMKKILEMMRKQEKFHEPKKLR